VVTVCQWICQWVRLIHAYRAAFALGQLIGARLLKRHSARDELLSAAARIGLPPTEADRTITSGLTAGARHPRQRTA
jgi:hypothetical protein